MPPEDTKAHARTQLVLARDAVEKALLAVDADRSSLAVNEAGSAAAIVTGAVAQLSRWDHEQRWAPKS